MNLTLFTFNISKYNFYTIRKWKSDTSDYDSETDKEEIPRSKSLAALRRQKQPTRRPTTKQNPRYKRKDNSFSANSDDEDASKSRYVINIKLLLLFYIKTFFFYHFLKKCTSKTRGS